MRAAVDLNCDMGESFGAWKMGSDAVVLEHVSSANIACGFHAGDPVVMHRTVQAAFEHGVAVGAHPSLPDLQGFGRRAMLVTPNEAYDLVLYQMGALAAFCRALGGRLSHVKAHGALYNMAAKDAELAAAIAQAVRDFDPGLVLFGLAGSELIRAGAGAGLKVANEVFADHVVQGTDQLQAALVVPLVFGSRAFGGIVVYVTDGEPPPTGAFEPKKKKVSVAGDSGGGVFQLVGGAWKLAGIMDTVQTLAKQPSWVRCRV
jgi:UPF0271 protein